MKWLTAFVLLLLSVAANGQSVRLEDQSDWWSMNNEKEHLLNVDLQHKSFNKNNLKILDLSLDTLGFDQVAAKLGKATIVNRGDASYSRSQVCYVSASNSTTVHLIFEGIEGGSSTFYLFQGGADWKGSNLCVGSSRVSAELTTGTGLKLGLLRTQVEAILGKPDAASGDRIAYCREFLRKATKEEFEKARQEYPERLSDKQAHQFFDLVPMTIQIEARFSDQKLDYLFVSTSELSGD
jgi:hypothetical protein